MIVDLLSQSIIITTGILLPAYYSYKSLRQKASTNRLIWLRYWVVFGFYYAITTITDILFSWFPLYSTCKILLLLWLSSSKASGAQIVFNFAVLPLLRNREPVIDRQIEEAKKQLSIYFWKFVTSTGINWSLVVAAALKSCVGILSVDDLKNASDSQEMDVTKIQRDAVDGAFSDEEPMATEDEARDEIQTTPLKQPPCNEPTKKTKGRATKTSSRQMKAEEDE